PERPDAEESRDPALPRSPSLAITPCKWDPGVHDPRLPSLTRIDQRRYAVLGLPAHATFPKRWHDNCPCIGQNGWRTVEREQHASRDVPCTKGRVMDFSILSWIIIGLIAPAINPMMIQLRILKSITLPFVHGTSLD